MKKIIQTFIMVIIFVFSLSVLFGQNSEAVCKQICSIEFNTCKKELLSQGIEFGETIRTCSMKYRMCLSKCRKNS